ncbi:SDR family NAD(P)-dependent oxidoreductase [Microbulbifer sp. OS29]|uniref:SDR family NAD(P)-dependent oxidoreductase n=1 Tax=Microbulbifer okhotskensis TaxID=2926617 RepID=A0A9X2EP22_9GAMM|nr:SDR family NAD(P)-dependent oxidoreductase [Microbulbifer okhotskensis]MCO1335794.1 SDR family NAD(P)-dependent oxidoreductase [Microbulbifer okhotskensis]
MLGRKSRKGAKGSPDYGHFNRVGTEFGAKNDQLGLTVYATMKDTSKAEPLVSAVSAGASLKVMSLDVTDSESIQACVDTILKESASIDVLINNAGVGFVKTTEHISEDELRWNTDVNYLVVVRCTKAVLPHIRRACSGHVVNI